MSDKKIIITPSNINSNDLMPEPAVKFVPEWYKSLAKHGDTNDQKNLNPVNQHGADGALVATKMCLPFYDAITSGYMALLNDDLIVKLDEEGFPTMSWKSGGLLIDKRPTIEVAVPYKHHPLHFGWRMNFYYKTPENYSLLMTHPMNRFDLPFTTMSGIVDSDIWGLPVFIAFFLKTGFEGVIPKGTPIMQLVPIKRNSWNLEIDNSESTYEQHDFDAEKRRSRVYGYYKKNVWQKKEYDKQ
jgi:hypothetical protein